jgi:DNA-binding LytR/AlgR family response regulator
MTGESLRALIVDDEPPARHALARLLRDLPGIEAVGTAPDGLAALDMLARVPVDLLFLDIEMPALGGLELAARLRPAVTPVVIFVTAWPQYAVEAFAADAADYLLKPVDPARLADAVARAGQRLARVALDDSLRVLRTRQPAQTAPDHVWVEHGASRLKLRLADVEWFAADGDYVQAHTAERGYLMRGSLNQLEATLPSSRFLRVHRSTLVHIDAVVRVAVAEGVMLLTTRSGVALKVGRRARSCVRNRLVGNAPAP